MFMESLVSTVIATSLAAMAADLKVDPVTLKLAFTAYFVALAMFIPISGWCADRYGAKTVFRAAIAVFTLSSIACALSWDLSSLVAGRFCQGLGGAMMLPVGRLILLRVIPKRELVSAMAWLSIPALFAPIMGPPVGGLLFRIAVRALPFLLPLMLQLGFGLSAFQSGSLTFAAAVGAVTMKLTAAPILRRFGFKRVLSINAVTSSVLLAAAALFTAQTPHVIIIFVLLIGGFFRSLQFTSLNALAYADIETEQMSRATSFVAVVQQLSLSGGVAVAALMLDVLRASAGRGKLIAADFSYAFIAIGVISLLPALMYFRLTATAGAEVSGHGQLAEKLTDDAE